MTTMRPTRTLATACWWQPQYRRLRHQPTRPAHPPHPANRPSSPHPPPRHPDPDPDGPGPHRPPAHPVGDHQPHHSGRVASWCCPPRPAPSPSAEMGRQHHQIAVLPDPHRHRDVQREPADRPGHHRPRRLDPGLALHRDESLLAHLSVIAVGAQRHRQPWSRSASTTPTRRSHPVGDHHPHPAHAGRLPAATRRRGKVVFQVRAVNTQRVRFFLSPTGTDTSARLVRTPTARRLDPGLATPTNLDRPPHRPGHRIRQDQPRHRPRPLHPDPTSGSTTTPNGSPHQRRM